MSYALEAVSFGRQVLKGRSLAEKSELRPAGWCVHRGVCVGGGGLWIARNCWRLCAQSLCLPVPSPFPHPLTAHRRNSIHISTILLMMPVCLGKKAGCRGKCFRM